MKKPFPWKKALSALLFLALVLLLVWYVWQNRGEMSALLPLSKQTVWLLLLLALLSCVLNALYHREFLRTFGLKLTVVDWLGVVCVSNAIAYVLPLRADLVFSAAYYKKKSGLAYTKSVSMAGGNIVFGVGMALLQVLIALLAIGLQKGVWPAALWLVTLLGLAATVVFVLFARFLTGRFSAVLEKHHLVREVAQGFNALLGRPSLLLRLTAIQLASNAVNLFMTMVCFGQAGLQVSFFEAMFYAGVSWLSGVVAIVPGNIGIKESILGVSTMLLGAVFQNGVAASLLIRVAVMAVYLALGLLFAWPVYRNLRGKEKTAP